MLRDQEYLDLSQVAGPSMDPDWFRPIVIRQRKPQASAFLAACSCWIVRVCGSVWLYFAIMDLLPRDAPGSARCVLSLILSTAGFLALTRAERYFLESAASAWHENNP